jgi:DNA-binding transcriptional LysR family regulator
VEQEAKNSENALVVDAHLLYMKTQLSFRQIEAFRAVMVAGTVVGAARLLNVTQPGVSRTISLMELRLGYALFHRTGRRLVPTPEAEALYREVEHLSSGLERISQFAHDLRYQKAGALRIACLPALAQGLVPRAVARFLASRPEVSVFLQSLPSRQIAELVATRQFDLGLVELPLNRSAIEVVPLGECRSVVVLPPGHALARHETLSLKQLHGERMILLSQQSVLRYQIDEAFSQAGAVPEVIVETPSSSIACALAAAGVGATIVSKWTAEPYREDGVHVRPLAETLESRHVVVYPRLPSRMHLAEAFETELRALLD